MKRLISLILAALFAASALASCAPGATGTQNANIRLTSSDAESVAAWLTDRLGDTLSDRVVLGTQADGFGVDLSRLEDDGYVIRRINGEIALLARTVDGLDRAARRYAKAAQKGESIENETYHEGYRIEELRLAGNDISTYAIKTECKSAYFQKEVTDNTAYTLSRLLGRACGFAPAVGGEAPHYIVLRQIDDPAFRESSYRYHFEGDDLVIEFIEIFGSKNGAVMFLQNECGWTDLMYGMDVLEENDLVDVPADLDVTLHPTLAGGLTQTTADGFRAIGTSLGSESWYLFNRSYRIPSAHHALGRIWASDYGHKNTGHLPCLTDDEVFEVTADEIGDNIASRLAAGDVLGEGMAHIDLGMEDQNNWCSCKDCYKLFLDLGRTWAGPMVCFANRMEEEMDRRGYDGVKYSFFAYAGSNPPPTVAPNDDVYPTLVLHDACDVHFYDGSQCTGSVPSAFMAGVNRSYTGGKRLIFNNFDWGEWIRGWHDLGAHLYIRVATLSNVFSPFGTMYVMYENMRFFAENGCLAIYNETYVGDGLDFNHIVHELYQVMQFNPGMSRADFFAEYHRLLEKYYGDGWRGVLTFAEELRRAELAGTCRSSWSTDVGRYDYKTFAASWEGILAALDDAIYNAGSAKEQRMCEHARCAAIYMGCLSTFFYAYNAGDEATLDLARARWGEMIAVFEREGLTPAENGAIVSNWGISYLSFPIYVSLDDHAWIRWKGSYADVLEAMGVTGPKLPAPAEYRDAD